MSLISMMSGGNAYSPLPTNVPQSEAENAKVDKTANPYLPRRTMLVTKAERLHYMSSWLCNLDGLPFGAAIKETFHGICIVILIFWDMPPRHFVHFLFVFISYM